MFKAALMSGWHVHAEGYAEEFNRIPGCRVAAVWDEDPARGLRLADRLGCPFYDTAEAALSAPGVTAGILNSPTTAHLPLIELMAGLGKHIFTEKVLAATHEEALRAREAVERAGVIFAISFPHLGNPGIKAAKAILDAGRLGQAAYARVRNVHNGAVAGWLPAHFYDAAQCGGGAMIDLGAHPMYTLAHLLGRPETVQSLFTGVTGRPVEDNAVCLLRFPGGAIGVSETGFVSSGNPYTLEISGARGSLMLHESLRVCDETTGMKWQAVADLPPPSPSPLKRWAQACLGQGSVPEELGMAAAVRLSAIMDAAYRAHRSGCAAGVPG
jgi:1,5-anhydro-D-fructose reductase (1,5-anhydro-D-mannitol-forming)